MCWRFVTLLGRAARPPGRDIAALQMTRDTPFDQKITDQETFDALLAQFIEAAARNDVDIEGTREYRTETDGHDLEVMIFALGADEPSE